MPERRRGAVLRVVSFLLLVCLFAPSGLGMAVPLLRAQARRCCCCRDGSCPCCRRGHAAAGQAGLKARSCCPRQCGCAGVFAAERLLPWMPAAAGGAAIGLRTAKLATSPAPRAASRECQPARQRPPPVFA